MFDLDRSQPQAWLPRLQPVLAAAFGQALALPERQRRSLAAFLETLPGVARVMLDGTERPRQRPQDPEAQKLHDAGKKRRHTRKQLAAVDQRKRVLVLTQAREGKVPAQKCHDEDDIAGSLPDEMPIEVDLRLCRREALRRSQCERSQAD